MEIHESILKLVAIHVADLSDQETLALFMSLMLGQSLEGKLGVEKLSPLFTEGPYQMTGDVKEVFLRIAGQRVQNMKKG